MENIYLNKTSRLVASIKDADSKKGIITGYFSAFNNVDSDNDIIMPGAFARTIEERGPNSKQPRIKHLLNHRIDQPLGKLLVLAEDDKGLYYESKAGTHSLGREFIKMVESELISEHSIGFRTIKWERDQDNDAVTKLTELQLWEGSSLTAWGANSQTPLTGMKGQGQDPEKKIDEMLSQHHRIEKFCRDTDVSDETIEELLLYNKQLLQHIINFASSTEPGFNSILPQKEVVNNTISKWAGKTDPFLTLFNLKQNEKQRKVKAKWHARSGSRIAATI
jgi:HK97 family phage prohead protease